jgi:hypothetical protein
MLMSPYHYDGYLDPTSVENRIWVMGMELVGVIPEECNRSCEEKSNISI